MPGDCAADRRPDDEHADHYRAPETQRCTGFRSGRDEADVGEGRCERRAQPDSGKSPPGQVHPGDRGDRHDHVADHRKQHGGDQHATAPEAVRRYPCGQHCGGERQRRDTGAQRPLRGREIQRLARCDDGGVGHRRVEQLQTADHAQKVDRASWHRLAVVGPIGFGAHGTIFAQVA